MDFKQYKNISYILGSAVEVMKTLPDDIADSAIIDLPYEVTQHKNDVKIPFPLMWEQLDRVVKVEGSVILFAQGLFYVDLVNSNRKNFRYDIVWDKVLTSGFLDANRKPLRQHEQIAVFQRKPRKTTYNPQFTEGKPLHSKGVSYKNKKHKNENYGNFEVVDDNRAGSTQKYPTSIIRFQKPHPSKALHRTEKPVECLEWLVKTYTNEGDTIIDCSAGSFSLGEACINTNRKAILIEKYEEEYFIGQNRLLKLC